MAFECSHSNNFNDSKPLIILETYCEKKVNAYFVFLWSSGLTCITNINSLHAAGDRIVMGELPNS